MSDSGLPFDDFRELIRNLPGPDLGAERAVREREASEVYSVAASPGSPSTIRREVTGRDPTRSTTAARCSGVVPQHPPMRPRPNSRTNCSCAVASSAGVSG